MRENEVELFVAMRDGQPVGRIAAIVNRARLARHPDRTGQFGFLEALDDPEVFDALVEAACGFLRGHGMARIDGPFSLTINHEAGLLVVGFRRTSRRAHEPRAALLRPPPRAARLREGDGSPRLCVPGAESRYPERVAGILARSGELGLTTHGLSARPAGKRGSRRVNALYNDAWAANWAAVAVSDAEAGLIASLSRPVVRPSWIRIAEHDGEPVALVGQIPDMNEVAPRDGRLLPFGMGKHLLGGIHLAGTRRSRIAMIGVASRWRGTRLGSLAISRLMAEAIEQARAHASRRSRSAGCWRRTAPC